MKALAKALHDFQAAAPPIHLDATNPHFRSRYASLGGVVAAVRPALNRHGLAYTQIPTNIDGAPALETTLIHAESGEILTATTPLILPKQDPQGYGSALTYTRRYALLSILGLVGDDDDDANTAINGGGTEAGAGAGSTQRKSSPNAAASSTTDPGDAVVGFGKHKGSRVRDVPASYWEWWIGQDPPKTQAQQELRANVELFLAGATDGVATPVSADDIPF